MSGECTGAAGSGSFTKCSDTDPTPPTHCPDTDGKTLKSLTIVYTAPAAGSAEGTLGTIKSVTGKYVDDSTITVTTASIVADKDGSYCSGESNDDDKTPDVVTTSETTTPEETTRPNDILICPFKKSNVKLIIGGNGDEIKPINDTYEYDEPSCAKNHEGITWEEKSLKISTDNEIDYVDCEIPCSYNKRNGKAIITIAVIKYEPYINKFVSKAPVIVNSSQEFTARIFLSYPTVSGIDNSGKHNIVMNISLDGSNTNNFEFDNNNEQSNDTIFEWDNLFLNYTNNTTEQPTNGESSDTTPVGLLFQSDKFNLNINYTVNVYHGGDVCPSGFDPQGLCCNRTYDGEYCTKVQVAYSFNDSGNSVGDFASFANTFIDSLEKLFNGSSYWIIHNKGNENDIAAKKIRLVMKYIKGSTFPDNSTLDKIDKSESEDTSKNKRDLEEKIFDWNQIEEKGIDPIEFVNAVMTVVAPSDSYIQTENDNDNANVNNEIKKSIETTLNETIPPEILTTDLGDLVKELTQNIVFVETVKKITVVAQENNIKKDAKEYYAPKTQIGETIDHSEAITTPKPKSWAEKNWWVILLICIGSVLLIMIIVIIIFMSMSISVSNKSKEEMKKSEKIMETIVPIEKIKEENGVTDDEIYKPFSYEIIMEGYLLKEGNDRIIDKWQRRYFVLYFDPAMLRIYESMIPSYYGKVYVEEKQNIPLECYNGIEYKEGSNEFTLILKVNDSSIKSFDVGEKERKVHLKVEGDNKVETAKKWVECFRDFKNQKPKSGDAWTKPLIIDEEKGKISTNTSKAFEKKNEEIMRKAQERRQAKLHIQQSKSPY